MTKLYKNFAILPQGIVLSLTMFVGACSGSGVSVKPPVEIPRLDPRVEEPCVDPSVVGSYGEALVANRTALVICIERHGNVVAAYNEARTNLGPQ